MIKKYKDLFSKTILAMLLYLLANMVYTYVYTLIIGHINIPGMYATPTIMIVVGNIFTALFTIPVVAYIIKQMSDYKENLIPGSFRLYLPYVLWKAIIAILVLMPTTYFVMHKHYILSIAFPMLINLIFIKFELWLPMGINEKLSFKDSLVSSWNRLDIGWAIAIFIVSMIPGFIQPFISSLFAKAGINGMGLFMARTAIITIFSYLILLFTITVYWNILQREGKGKAQ